MSVIAKSEARKIIREYCINGPTELNLDEILLGEMIVLEESDLSEDLGRIRYLDDCGIIKVNSKIKEPGQKRYTIVHELGHFRLHNKNGEGCKDLEMLTHSNNNKNETEANIFAAELLMHEPWVKDFCKETEPSKELLAEASKYFGVSISAAGIRLTELDCCSMGIIMSKNGKVIWSSLSPSLPFKWIPNGYSVNRNSYAFDIFSKFQKKEGLFLPKELTEVNEVLADAWFWDDERNYKKDFEMYEQNIPMPNYNSVMTIVWVG